MGSRNPYPDPSTSSAQDEVADLPPRLLGRKLLCEFRMPAAERPRQGFGPFRHISYQKRQAFPRFLVAVLGKFKGLAGRKWGGCPWPTYLCKFRIARSFPRAVPSERALRGAGAHFARRAGVASRLIASHCQTAEAQHSTIPVNQKELVAAFGTRRRAQPWGRAATSGSKSNAWRPNRDVADGGRTEGRLWANKTRKRKFAPYKPLAAFLCPSKFRTRRRFEKWGIENAFRETFSGSCRGSARRFVVLSNSFIFERDFPFNSNIPMAVRRRIAIGGARAATSTADGRKVNI